MVTMLLVAVAVIAGAGAAGFAVLVAGIQVSERRAGLAGPPGRGADAFARWILSAQVGQPEVVAARLAGGPGQRAGGRAPSPCSPSRPARAASAASVRPGESS